MKSFLSLLLGGSALLYCSTSLVFHYTHISVIRLSPNGIMKNAKKAFSRSFRVDDADGTIVVTSERKTIDVCRNEISYTVFYSELCCPRSSKQDIHRAFDNIEKKLSSIVSAAFLQNAEHSVRNNKNHTSFVFPNVFCSKEDQMKPNDITLTTHCSVDKLERLIAIAQRWNGPVSVSILIRTMKELDYLKRYIYDHPNQLSNVNSHLYLENSERQYPNNILRNLALQYSRSDFFALLDIDFFPSPLNTHHILQDVFQKNPALVKKLRERKTVFVMPAFEIFDILPDKEVTRVHAFYPESKALLLKELSKEDGEKKVAIFHESKYPQGHRSTNYSRWMSQGKDVSYPIQIQDHGFEPYIIGSKRGLPSFYPNFRGFGLNKFSFFVELHYAKYTFEVLRDVFVFHVNHNSTYGEIRDKGWVANIACTKHFVKYLRTQYGAGQSHNDKEVAGWDEWEKMSMEGTNLKEPAYKSPWENFTKYERAAAKSLGFTKKIWSKGSWPGGIESKYWNMMETEEQLALEILGYGERKWDDTIRQNGMNRRDSYVHNNKKK